MTERSNQSQNNLTAMEAGSRIIAFLVVFFVMILTLQLMMRTVLHESLSCLGAYRYSVYALLNLLSSVVAIIVSRYGLDKKYSNLGIVCPFNKATKAVLIGFLVGSVFVSLIIWLANLTGGYQILSIQKSVDLMPYLILFFIGAFHEELVFRGYFFQLIACATSQMRALLISSMLFGYAHMINDVVGASLLEKFWACSFLTVEAGLPLTMAFILTRNIWFAFGIHWAWNFVQGAIFGANVSGLELGDSIVSSKLAEGVFGGGGSFGPEYTVVGLCTGFCLFIVLAKLNSKLNS